MCLVQIPVSPGGYYSYEVEAASSMEAARIGLECHGEAVADDVVITVIVDGHCRLMWDAKEHNAKQPTYRHRAGVVRSRG